MQGNRTLRRAIGALSAGLLCATAGAQQLDFKLVAGGALGDGGLATQAYLNGAFDIVFDASGNMYVSQSSGNRIRKITTDGRISTVVGGVYGFGGDGGAASAAKIGGPEGLAIDAAGNLYFVDAGNARVRRIAPNGTITTVAGSGSHKYTGDGGQALQAGFVHPTGLALDATGNLYVSDASADVVRRIGTDGVITTVAGAGASTEDNVPATTALLEMPWGIDLDGAGNLYIATMSGVKKVGTDGLISTLLPGGAMGVGVTSDGTVYADDSGACTIVRWSAGVASAVAGNGNCMHWGDGGPASWAGIGIVNGLALDGNGNVYFSAAEFGTVRKVTVAADAIALAAGTGPDFDGGRPAVGAPLDGARGIAVDAYGNIALAEVPYASRVLLVTPDGKVGVHAQDAVAIYPFGIALASDGATYVSQRSRGLFKRTAGLLSPVGGLEDAYGIAADRSGNVFVADNFARVWKVDSAGVATVFAGGTLGTTGDGGQATSAALSYPDQLAIDAAGNVYIGTNGKIRKVDTTGVISTIAGENCCTEGPIAPDGVPAIGARIGGIASLAVDASGVYFATDVVRRVTPDGLLDTVEGMPSYPLSVAIRSGRLSVAGRDGRVWRARLAGGYVANDYDGGRQSDIAWRNVQTGANVIWKGGNSATTQTVMGVNNLAWKIAGQGDFDGDGKSDLLWRNGQSGANVLWRTADYTTQIPVATVANLAWTIAGVGDFDDDGTSDLFWRNPVSGQNVIWHASNAGQQTVLASIANTAWQAVGVGDFDGDGKSDILWRNPANGSNAIWRSGDYTTQVPITAVTNPAWKIQGVGDFDGDGKSDVFWRNTATGANVIWNGGNSALQRALTPVASQTWRVVSVGDYDGDGKADLSWRNSANGANSIWRSGDAATPMAVTGVSNPAWTIVPYENQP